MVNIDYSLGYKIKKIGEVWTGGKLKLERKGCAKKFPEGKEWVNNQSLDSRVRNNYVEIFLCHLLFI